MNRKMIKGGNKFFNILYDSLYTKDREVLLRQNRQNAC